MRLFFLLFSAVRDGNPVKTGCLLLPGRLRNTVKTVKEALSAAEAVKKAGFYLRVQNSLFLLKLSLMSQTCL